MRIGVALQVVVNRLRGFPRATRGNIAMIFGLALIPICIAVGVGLDMSRAMITRARMGTALDAAGLAVGSQPSMTQDDMQKLAREYFKQNYTADDGAYGTPTEVMLDRPSGSQTITLSTSVQMPTILMRIVGINTMDVGAKSEITWGQTKLWVGLVLDNTGSMCQYPAAPNISTCPTPNAASKIVALKTATHSLLQMLQNAASNDGDVKVSIIPFSKDVNVGTSNVAATWIDWSNWDSAPPNAVPGNTVGPGSTCPWTSGTDGFKCMIGPANGSTTVSTVPSIPSAWSSSQSYSTGNQVTYSGTTYISVKSGSNHTPSGSSSYWKAQAGNYTGYICPSMDSGAYNTGNGSTTLDAASHYYNGCYNSVAQSTKTTTQTNKYTKTDNYSCQKVGSAAPVCTLGSSSNGTATTNTTTQTQSGYSGESGPTTTSVSGTPGAPSDGTQTCTTKKSVTTCTWTRKIATDVTDTTVTKTGANFSHTWISNAHSSWTGCIMDRAQDYDTLNTAPTGSAKFPAENSDYCLQGQTTGLSSTWSTLSSQVDAMTANGNTNQTVGLNWGWQTLTNTDPYNPGELPEGTRKVIILLTDGLNTQNRWSGDQDTIDDRTEAICSQINAPANAITVYTVQVDTGSDGESQVLKDCATDSDHYVHLTAATQIEQTFKQIGTEITNLRVSL